MLRQRHVPTPLGGDVTGTFTWEARSPLKVTSGLWDTNPKGTFQSYPHTVFKAEANIKTRSLESCRWPLTLSALNADSRGAT